MKLSYGAKRKLAKIRYSKFGEGVQKFYDYKIGKGVIHFAYLIPFVGAVTNLFIPKRKKTKVMKFLTYSSPAALTLKILAAPTLLLYHTLIKDNLPVQDKTPNQLEQIIKIDSTNIQKEDSTIFMEKYEKLYRFGE